MKLLLLLCVFLELTINVIGQPSASNGDVSDSKISSSTSTSSQNYIEIVALDRLNDFGDLYDATTDNFMFFSAFNGKEKPEDLNIITTNITSSKIDFVLNETYVEKMEKFDIQPSLYLSSLSDLVKISSTAGAATYLIKNKKSDKSIKSSLIYKIRSIREELQALPNIPRSIISDIIFNNRSRATHVLVGIEWGVDAVLSLEQPNPDPSNAAQLRGKFADALKSAADMITTTNQIDSSKFAEVERGNIPINVDLLSDYISFVGFISTNDPDLQNYSPISNCLSHIRNLPNLMRDEGRNGKKHNGKGRRVKYILMPINKFVEAFGGQSNPQKEVKQPSQETSKEFLQILQNLEDSELQISEIDNRMRKLRIIFKDDEMDRIEKLENEFNKYYREWRDLFETRLVKYRKGIIGDDELHQLISSYSNSTWTPEKTKAELDAMKPTLRKLELASRLNKAQASFIDEDEIFYRLFKDDDNEVRVVSVDLNKDNAEHYVNEIVKILGAESAKTIRNYVVQKDIEIPEVKIYRDGKEADTFTINKKE